MQAHININELPGDFWSQKSPQTLLAIFAGPFDFEHMKEYENLKVTSRRPRNIHDDVLSSSRIAGAMHILLLKKIKTARVH